MLLTSSQVSVLLSSFIVVSCTTALFLSGYVIQQRTVNQLRVAIKQQSSRPSPKPYLPDRFRSTTTELEDGTIVVLDDESDVFSQQQQQQRQPQPQMIFIEPSGPGSGQKIVMPITQREKTAQRLFRTQRELERDLAGKETERERNVRLLTDKNQLNPDPAAVDQRPISRAERRRLIKEELSRLSHDSEPVYYQRRLY